MTTGRINQVATNYGCVAFSSARAEQAYSVFTLSDRRDERTLFPALFSRGAVKAASSIERRLFPPFEGSLTGQSDSYSIYTRPTPSKTSTKGTCEPRLPVTRKSLGRAASISPFRTREF